jgi:hypothetical protein
MSPISNNTILIINVVLLFLSYFHSTPIKFTASFLSTDVVSHLPHQLKEAVSIIIICLTSIVFAWFPFHLIRFLLTPSIHQIPFYFAFYHTLHFIIITVWISCADCIVLMSILHFQKANEVDMAIPKSVTLPSPPPFIINKNFYIPIHFDFHHFDHLIKNILIFSRAINFSIPSRRKFDHAIYLWGH